MRVDEGYPRRLEQHFTDLPAEFESGLEAAFAEPGSSRVHLFKDGRTVSPAAGDRIVRRVDKRWGQLGPVLPTGTVDAAFVGVDGRTYLFSGDRYLRYTGADYSRVDAGYPRRIAADWAGIVGVDAAFVLDGTTHVFGTAGRAVPHSRRGGVRVDRPRAQARRGRRPARAAGTAARARSARGGRPGGGRRLRVDACRSTAAPASSSGARPTP